MQAGCIFNLLLYRRRTGMFAASRGCCSPAIAVEPPLSSLCMQVYEPFFADFGPLNLGLAYRYCQRTAELLKVCDALHILCALCTNSP